MTEDEMRNLVSQCGLDWQRGYKQYYYSPPRHRYKDLIEATINKTVEEIADMFDREAEDWSHAAAAKLRKEVRLMDRIRNPRDRRI